MLTLKMLRDDPQFVVRKLAVKNFDAEAIVEEVLALDAERRNCQTESDALLGLQKQKAAQLAKIVGAKAFQSFRDGGGDAAKATVTKLSDGSTQISDGSVCTTCVDGVCTTGACSRQ